MVVKPEIKDNVQEVKNNVKDNVQDVKDNVQETLPSVQYPDPNAPAREKAAAGLATLSSHSDPYPHYFAATSK